MCVSACLFIYLSVYPVIYLSIYISLVCLFISSHPFVYAPVCLFIKLSTSLHIWLSIHLCICPSKHSSVYLSIFMYLASILPLGCPFIIYLPVCLSICVYHVSTCLSFINPLVCLSIHLLSIDLTTYLYI